MRGRRFVSIVLVPALALACAVAVAAERPTEQRIREILVDRVDRARQSVGIVVGIVDPDGTLVVGHGRLGPGDAATPDGRTVYEIGSITKVFTATLLAQAVRDKELGLHDPVQRYLPDSVRFRALGERPVSLYDLATHTSGLPRMPENFAPADSTNPYADYTVERLYAFLNDFRPTRAPGERAEYSNVGMGLLGHVLARHAETDYESLVRERIAGPLGMDDTRVSLTGDMRSRLAHGHDATLRPVPNWDLTALAGAGALRSTTDDMLRFLAANLRLVDTPLAGDLRETQGPRERFGGEGRFVGLGWMIRKRYGRTIRWHNGGTGGYRTFVGFDPQQRRGVVVLSNAANSVDDIGFHLLDPRFALASIEPPARSSSLPDSPAGRALRGWLEATRSDDPEVGRVHYEVTFAPSFKASVPLERYVEIRERLRATLEGAQIVDVVAPSPTALTAYARRGSDWLALIVAVTPDDPHLISTLLVRPTDAPADAPRPGQVPEP